MKRLIFLSFFCGLAGAALAQPAVVIVPIADVRSEPSLPAIGQSDDLQQTQVLYGEQVEVILSSGEWVRIHAVEQPEYTTDKHWEGYPGWIPQTAVEFTTATLKRTAVVSSKWLATAAPKGHAIQRLPLGSRVRVLQKQETLYQIALPDGRLNWVPSAGLRDTPPSRDSRRAKILETAELLIGDAYVWGGLSPQDPARRVRLSGVDCSGLVHLAYRVNGVIVPRDSMEQYLRARKIPRQNLQPGDLIFSAKADKPNKVTHVALYAGGEELIEAPQTGMTVRRVSFKEKFGQEFTQVDSGGRVDDRIIYFGRLLRD